MKKLIYLIVLTLILGLVLTGCTLLSNISQVPASEQSGVSCLTKGEFDAECPAAPAVAGLLLEAAGVDNRYGTGKEGGNFIKDVANFMGPETDFYDVDKCDIENYRIEIAKFLILQGAKEVEELFQAELESVVYEGICNKFGTHLDDTITLTFSNNVAILGDDQDIAETRVDFENAGSLGHNSFFMVYQASGNEVIITVVGTFGTPRPEVGDFVTGLNGIVDALGNPVIVPGGGVEIEGIVVTYALRDTGPAGGLIFYVKEGGYSDGWMYLEAAPASTEWGDKEWGSWETWIGGTGRDIGTGQVNTNLIVAAISGETDRAAQLCDALGEGETYDDWFLPSKDELNKMWVNLKSGSDENDVIYDPVGGFAYYYYWSSSEDRWDLAWLQGFGSGLQHYCNKLFSGRVRAVRAF